eukprot:COSAG02_NODE_352_length_24036_cov_20.479258_13_plen_197_part_00
MTQPLLEARGWSTCTDHSTRQVLVRVAWSPAQASFANMLASSDSHAEAVSGGAGPQEHVSRCEARDAPLWPGCLAVSLLSRRSSRSGASTSLSTLQVRVQGATSRLALSQSRGTATPLYRQPPRERSIIVCIADCGVARTRRGHALCHGTHSTWVLRMPILHRRQDQSCMMVDASGARRRTRRRSAAAGACIYQYQ